MGAKGPSTKMLGSTLNIAATSPHSTTSPVRTERIVSIGKGLYLERTPAMTQSPTFKERPAGKRKVASSKSLTFSKAFLILAISLLDRRKRSTATGSGTVGEKEGKCKRLAKPERTSGVKWTYSKGLLPF